MFVTTLPTCLSDVKVHSSCSILYVGAQGGKEKRERKNDVLLYVITCNMVVMVVLEFDGLRGQTRTGTGKLINPSNN